MRSVPTTSLDLTAAEVVADPYPYFAEERAPHAVAWHEPSGQYLTFDHASASAVLRDRRLGRIWRDKEPVDRLRAVQPAAPQPDDGERAARAHPAAPAGGRGVRPRSRRAAAAAGPGARGRAARRGGPGRLRRDRGVRRAAAGAGDRRAARRPASYAPRPARLVAGDRADVRGGRDPEARGRSPRRRRRRSSRRWSASASPSAAPTRVDDLIPTWTATGLTDDEVVASAVLLLNAGHEASVNVFGNGLVAMLAPRSAARRRRGADCVEEMLRFDSALQLFERTATEPSSGRRRHVSRRAEDRRAARRGQPRPGGLRTPDEFAWSTATPTRTWRSASACTSASARRWPGWSWWSRSAAVRASRTWTLAGEPGEPRDVRAAGFRSPCPWGPGADHRDTAWRGARRRRGDHRQARRGAS